VDHVQVADDLIFEGDFLRGKVARDGDSDAGLSGHLPEDISDRLVVEICDLR
jgi:hypothetical protein